MLLPLPLLVYACSMLVEELGRAWPTVCRAGAMRYMQVTP